MKYNFLLAAATVFCSVSAAAERALLINGDAKALSDDGVYQLTEADAWAGVDSLVITNATLDLNGFDCTVRDAHVVLTDALITTITNSSETEVTLTARPDAGTTSTYRGNLAGKFIFRKCSANGNVVLDPVKINNNICTSVWVCLLMYESVIFKGFLRGACRGKYAIVRVCYKVCYTTINLP